MGRVGVELCYTCFVGKVPHQVVGIGAGVGPADGHQPVQEVILVAQVQAGYGIEKGGARLLTRHRLDGAKGAVGRLRPVAGE